MTVNASTDHQFLGWDGPTISISISKNPLELDVDSDKQVKANSWVGYIIQQRRKQLGLTQGQLSGKTAD